MSEKITYSYYTSAQASQNTFYRLPRALYEKEYFRVLSNDAKTLYVLMFDLMSLSLQNDWLDEVRRAYINYNLESILETLGCGKTKAVALLKKLDSESGIGLIEKKSMGLARASVFYVKNFMLEDEIIEHAENYSALRTQKTNSQEDIEFNNRTYTCSKNEPDRVQNLNPNKTNINKTDFSKTILSYLSIIQMRLMRWKAIAR